MLIDTLAGGLSGAGCYTDAGMPMAGKTDGVFPVAVKIEAFTPLIEFQQSIGRLVHLVKSSPLAPGVTKVLVPGELEERTRRHRLREGIPIEPTTWHALEQILGRFHLAIEDF